MPIKCINFYTNPL